MDKLRLLTVAQVAAKFGVDARTVRGWCDRGLLPGAMQTVKTGRGAIWLVPEDSLIGFVPPKRGPKPRPRRFTDSELAKVGVTITKADGQCMRCQVCGAVWAANLLPGARLPRGYWRCPNGCNADGGDLDGGADGQGVEE